MPTDQIPQYRELFRKYGVTLHLTPPDPEKTKPTGGVGANALATRQFQHLPNHTSKHEAFQLASAQGRVARYAINVGLPQPLIVFNVYAWPCGDTSATAAKRNEAIFLSILREIQFAPPTYTL